MFWAIEATAAVPAAVARRRVFQRERNLSTLDARNPLIPVPPAAKVGEAYEAEPAPQRKQEDRGNRCRGNPPAVLQPDCHSWDQDDYQADRATLGYGAAPR